MATQTDKDCKPFSLTQKRLCWWMWQEGSWAKWIESRLPVSVLQKSEVACQMEAVRGQYDHNATLKTTLREKNLLTQPTHSTLGILLINNKCKAAVWEPTHHHGLTNFTYPGEKWIFPSGSYQGCMLQHSIYATTPQRSCSETQGKCKWKHKWKHIIKHIMKTVIFLGSQTIALLDMKTWCRASNPEKEKKWRLQSSIAGTCLWKMFLILVLIFSNGLWLIYHSF